MIQEEELRRDDGRGSWRRKGVSIVGHELIDVVDCRRFDSGAELASLLPRELETPFTNRELAQALHVRLRMAQRMSYCLRQLDVLDSVGKRGRELLFAQSAAG
jgi:hypothetical protein